MSKAEAVREDVSDKKYTMSDIEEIEKAVRIIHRPQSHEPYNTNEQEQLYDRKVLYYIKLGVSVKAMKAKAKKVQKQYQDNVAEIGVWMGNNYVSSYGFGGGASGYSGYQGISGYSGYSGPSTESIPCSSSLWRGPEKKVKKKVQKKELSLSISAVSESRSGWGNKPQGCKTLEVKGRECRKNSCSA